MKKLIFLLLISAFLFGCEKEEMNLPSSYPELSGSYKFDYYRTWDNGLYEEAKFEAWKFDNTRKAWYYFNNWSYTSKGWTNALKQATSWEIEWKIENGVFYEKLWDNEYSEWKSHKFEYINTNSFKLDGDLYVRD